MELKFDSRTDTVTAFATQFYLFEIDGSERLNEALKALILAKELEQPGVRRSNIGGWHSDDDLFSWPDRAVEVLQEAALGAIKAVVPLMVGGSCEFQTRLAAWANVSRSGAYNKRHTHPNCQVSAVYYVEAGTPPNEDAPENGTFEFLDPRSHAEMSALPGEAVGRSTTIKPLNGRMVLFPSWLYHQVNPYHGEAERISISFNAHISNLQRT
jgi:uncharacterized protein (TIGR02466 family)